MCFVGQSGCLVLIRLKLGLGNPASLSCYERLPDVNLCFYIGQIQSVSGCSPFLHPLCFVSVIILLLGMFSCSEKEMC